MSTPFPPDVKAWLRDVFQSCDNTVTQKISNNPNIQEESLDQSWIDRISQFSSPLTLSSGWTVKLETHFLGGLRQFGAWEIADIGLLLFIRRNRRVVRSKVALIQSKRLYPSNRPVREGHSIDYQIGFARLADPEDLETSIAVVNEYSFDEDCKYKALQAGSEQVCAIKKYERERSLSVYYQLYNPWEVPFTQRIPLSSYTAYPGVPKIGTRVVSSAFVHNLLRGRRKSFSPSLGSLCSFATPYGWTLADFVADEFLECREGNIFENISDERIENLFYRRSGPISAAIAVSIELPD